ncbi:MAG: transposase [Bacteroidota bacterium]
MSEFLKTEEGKAYFITCTVVDWIDIFTRETYVNILIDSIKYCQKNKGLEVYAYCILPSHFHMIARAKDGTLGILLKDLKGFTARKILDEIKNNQQESRREWLLEAFKKAGAKSSQKQNYQFWQHDNFPVELYSDKFIIQKETYIHMNPVEIGFVSKPEYYRLSSASDESPIQIMEWR